MKAGPPLDEEAGRPTVAHTASASSGIKGSATIPPTSAADMSRPRRANSICH